MKKNIVVKELLLVVVTILWGFGFIFQEIGGKSIDAYTLTFLRIVFGAIFLFIVSIVSDFITKKNKEKIDKKNFKELIILGFVLGVILSFAMILQQIGINLEGAGKSGFLTCLYIIFVPIISSLFGKKLSIFVIISIVFSTLGLFLINFDDSGFNLSLGTVLLIGCAIFYSIQIMVLEKYSKNHNSFKLPFIEFIFCAILILPFMLIFGNSDKDIIIDALPVALFLGIFPSGLAYVLQTYSQKEVNATLACIIMSLESVFALILSIIFLKSEITLYQLLGCLSIFVALILSQIKIKEKSQ